MSEGTSVDDILSEARAFIDEIDEERAAIRAATAQARQKNQARNEENANARRSGAHGPAWQVLQQRIDLGRTTESDIVNGLDHSDEARVVRAQAGVKLAGLRDAYQKILNEPDEKLQGSLEELARSREELAAQLARLHDAGSPR